MPGISFLFWNVKQQPLRERVARLVAAHSVDVVILAERATPGESAGNGRRRHPDPAWLIHIHRLEVC